MSEEKYLSQISTGLPQTGYPTGYNPFGQNTLYEMAIRQFDQNMNNYNQQQLRQPQQQGILGALGQGSQGPQGSQGSSGAVGAPTTLPQSGGMPGMEALSRQPQQFTPDYRQQINPGVFSESPKGLLDPRLLKALFGG